MNEISLLRLFADMTILLLWTNYLSEYAAFKYWGTTNAIDVINYTAPFYNNLELFINGFL